jgi:2-keto-3-deoxy-L-rhamnonate aldolase
MTSPPTGVYVPVPTFFKPSSSSASASPSLQAAVDVDTQIQHSVFLAKNGVRGLVLLGSTGEAIHMSRQERVDLVSGVRRGLNDAGFSDYPIMAGTLINSIDETLEWLEDFKRAGAQWGLVLAPGYFGAAASQEGIREWYTVVADKSPLPILM